MQSKKEKGEKIGKKQKQSCRMRKYKHLFYRLLTLTKKIFLTGSHDGKILKISSHAVQSFDHILGKFLKYPMKTQKGQMSF